MNDAPTPSANRLLARGYLTSMGGVAVVRVSGFLFNTLLARWLGAGSFGEFVITLAVLQFALTLADAGFSSGVLRFVALHTGKKDDGGARASFLTGLYAVSLFCVPITAALLLFRHPLAQRFHSENLPWAIAFTAPFLIFLVLAHVFLSALQGRQLYQKMIVLRDILEPLFRLAACALLVLGGLKLGAALASHLAGQILLFACAGALLWKTLGLGAGPWKVSAAQAAPVVLFSVPILLSQLAGYLMQYTDTLVLGSLTAAREVGLYNAAQRWASIGGTPLAALTPIFLPIITRLYGEGKMPEIAEAFKNTTNGLIAVGWAILYATVAYAPFLMGVFGMEFQTPESILILRLLALSTFINLATGPTGALYYMSGRSKLMAYLSLGLVPATVIISYVFITRWGITGAALASVTVVAFSNVANVVLLFFLDKIHPYSTNALKIFALGALVTALSWKARAALPAPLLWEALLWGLAYPSALFFMFSKEIRARLVQRGYLG